VIKDAQVRKLMEEMRRVLHAVDNPRLLVSGPTIP